MSAGDQVASGDPAAPGSRRRRRLIVVALVVVVVAIAAYVVVRALGDGDAGSDVATSTAGVELLGAQLTSVVDGIDPATGLPTTERDSFEVGEGARLWLAFRYAGEDPGRASLEVVWSREGEELFRSSWRLPQPVENHNVALGSSYMQDPGDYEVSIISADEVMYTATFDVG